MPCQKPISLKESSNPLFIGNGRLVPCGECDDCLKAKRASWTFRIQQEKKDSKNAVFLTLTYDDLNLPKKAGKVTLLIPDLQKYFKRVRKDKEGKKLKYYAVGEYGDGTERPHYHAIVFNTPRSLLIKKWAKGHTKCDPCTDARIHYVTKYVIKKEKDEETQRQKTFSIMSKGLGKGYLERNTDYHKNKQTTTTRLSGHPALLPRYYRDKIFNDEEKAKIGLENKRKAQELISDISWQDEQNRREYLKQVNKLKSKSK